MLDPPGWLMVLPWRGKVDVAISRFLHCCQPAATVHWAGACYAITSRDHPCLLCVFGVILPARAPYCGELVRLAYLWCMAWDKNVRFSSSVVSQFQHARKHPDGREMPKVKDQADQVHEAVLSEAALPETGDHTYSWRRGVFFNATIVGLAAFAAPGLWNAMQSVGAGGQQTPYLVM